METDQDTLTSLRRNTRAEHPSAVDDGYFPPDSAIRKVTGEGVVLLGGGYAILMQLAHPFIAAGVDDHSMYQSDILARLYRTVYFMHSLVSDSKKVVHRNLDRFHAGHRRIRGRLGHRAGNFPPDTEYSGTDPEAKFWVHATMVDSVLKVYEQFIGPLSAAERRDYYEDTLLQARLLEIPEGILPQTLDEFQAYMDEMISGDTLAVTETGRRLGHAVLYPKVGMLPALSASLLRLVTADLLDERFRKAYGLRLNRTNNLLLKSFRNSIRFLRPVAPEWVWQSPLRNGRLLRFMLFS